MTTNNRAKLLKKAKVALRVVTSAFDNEILDLLDAGTRNLETRGVTVTQTVDNTELVDPLVQRCLITYVRLNFGEPSDYDRLKASFDEQLGQLMTTTGFTNWGE